MRQIIFLLCLVLTFTTVFSGNSGEDYDHHDDEHDHIGVPHYPIVIPNQSRSYVEVHSAETSEIGSQPPPPSQSATPQQNPRPTGNNDNNNDIHRPPSHGGYSAPAAETEHYMPALKVNNGGNTGYFPQFQKYGFPPGCVNVYDKDIEIDIKHTPCDYMVVIILKVEFKGHHVTKYAHFKMSRKMLKPYGYVACGLSDDDKMDDDHIVECVKSRNSVHPKMFHSWSNKHSMPTRLMDNSDIIKNKTENYDSKFGILTCEFDRPMITTIKYVKGDGPVQNKVFDLTKEKYNIFMAIGETAKPDSDILGHHGVPKNGAVSIFHVPEYYKSSTSGTKSEDSITILLSVIFGYLFCTL